jgi:hypothetical protein
MHVINLSFGNNSNLLLRVSMLVGVPWFVKIEQFGDHFLKGVISSVVI